MRFESIRIVLVGTSHPGNIGSSARAMKNMGFEQLYLVAPENRPNQNSYELAAGADDVLQGAIITDSLTQALADCHVVFATSARARELSIPGDTPHACAQRIAQHTDDTRIALVFGRERTGLTNAELLQCHYHVHIPSAPTFSSLNLAQAVQIITYEIRMALLSPPATVFLKQDQRASAHEVEQFYTHLAEVLTQINFIRTAHPKRLLQRLRRMFNRIQIEAMEVNLLRGMLTQIQRACTKESS